MEAWFESYPETGKADLRSRFRSPIDAQHNSAFWELYVHELFSRLGFALEPHPDIEGSQNHPDFLVKEDGVPKFYLEATVAGLPSAQDAGAEARLAEVFDLVNKMQISEWFLHVESRGTPDTPPPVRALRRQIEGWLASLDIKAIDALLRAEEWDDLPRFEWSHEGLTLSFTPTPKSPKAAGKAESRTIGTVMGEVQQLETDEDIRRAVESKSRKYGELALPLVIAVNVIAIHCDDIDINNALFGSEAIIYTGRPDGSFATRLGRNPNGILNGKRGARNQSVSAVLIGTNTEIFSCASRTPLLIHHPFPMHRLELESYPLPESLPDEATSTMKRKDGQRAAEILRLPEPWPPTSE